MSYRLRTSSEYDKSLKELAKKHRSTKKDVAKLYDNLEENPYQGALIGENTYKVRLAITSKGRGKSGGARIITYIIDEDETVFLVDIYDKSEQENIAENRIKTIIEGYNTEE
jgi:mRNA-degrading endonuclease RelE of RelBE toxin-antitoxin system